MFIKKQLFSWPVGGSTVHIKYSFFFFFQLSSPYFSVETLDVGKCQYRSALSQNSTFQVHVAFLVRDRGILFPTILSQEIYLLLTYNPRQK